MAEGRSELAVQIDVIICGLDPIDLYRFQEEYSHATHDHWAAQKWLSLRPGLNRLGLTALQHCDQPLTEVVNFL